MLTRAASRHNLALKWVKETTRRNETFLFVIFSETAVSAENVNIDQQIYFLTKSYDIFEKYKINGHLVRRKLGRFLNNDYQGESRNILIIIVNIFWIFLYVGYGDKSFIERRKNFHGSQLVALTDRWPGIIIDNDGPYILTNDTYDVTNQIKGKVINT